jgi:hypothetical protein
MWRGSMQGLQCSYIVMFAPTEGILDIVFKVGSFSDSQQLNYAVLNGRMTDELERIWKETGYSPS